MIKKMVKQWHHLDSINDICKHV